MACPSPVPAPQACGLPDRFVPNMLLALLWASQVGRLRCCSCCCWPWRGPTTAPTLPPPLPLAAKRAQRPSCRPSLWRVLQANAVPTIFWLLGFLLLPANKQPLAAAVSEARQAAGLAATPDGAAAGGAAGGAGTPAAAAKARARARASGAASASRPAPPRQGGSTAKGGGWLSEAQQAGLVELACNRHSRVAAAIAETLRLRCFSIDVRIAAADGVLPGGADGSGPGTWVQQVRWLVGRCGTCMVHTCSQAYPPRRLHWRMGARAACARRAAPPCRRSQPARIPATAPGTRGWCVLIPPHHSLWLPRLLPPPACRAMWLPFLRTKATWTLGCTLAPQAATTPPGGAGRRRRWMARLQLCLLPCAAAGALRLACSSVTHRALLSLVLVSPSPFAKPHVHPPIATPPAGRACSWEAAPRRMRRWWAWAACRGCPLAAANTGAAANGVAAGAGGRGTDNLAGELRGGWAAQAMPAALQLHPPHGLAWACPAGSRA